ncbi:MAG: hypothetical protein AAF639_31830 [Chloroflexota bacterium]
MSKKNLIMSQIEKRANNLIQFCPPTISQKDRLGLVSVFIEECQNAYQEGRFHRVYWTEVGFIIWELLQEWGKYLFMQITRFTLILVKHIREIWLTASSSVQRVREVFIGPQLVRPFGLL